MVGKYNAKVKIIDPKNIPGVEDLSKIPLDKRGRISAWDGISAWYRIFIPLIEDIERLIYLDSDIILLRDITELWEFGEDKIIYGVRDWI